jgi:polyphosphate kinase
VVTQFFAVPVLPHQLNLAPAKSIQSCKRNEQTNMLNSNFVNRELSWLEFNQRVLDQALNPDTPPLERARFLAISSSNLDEFFKVRVGGLKMLENAGIEKPDDAGFTPTEQLAAIRTRVRVMMKTMQDCLEVELKKVFAAFNFRRKSIRELNENQLEHVTRRFEQEFLPSLCPLAFDQSQFPLLADAPLCLCVRLQHSEEMTLAGPARDDQQSESDTRFAIVPIGKSTERMISLPASEGYEFILVENIIEHFIEEFFPNQKILECVPFRVTRNADQAVEDDAAVDLVSQMKELLASRKTGACVRLEIDEIATEELCTFLLSELDADQSDLYRSVAPIDLSFLFSLANIHGFDHLKDEPWPSVEPAEFQLNDDIFEVIREADRLLIHPYESFDPVVRFVEQAATDPNVISIKQTLYRTSKKSPIVRALSNAAKNGKNVTALVELKARFDEARNIEWAQQLERDGVNVVWGIKGLKTHSKICLVVRREPTGIQTYIHFGTGNYNEATAEIYSDVSLLTCDEQLGSDAISFFNSISGYSVPQSLKKLSAAPVGLRESIMELIEIETANAEQGIPAFFDAKVNSLVDKEIIDALYKASAAGVKIRLNIRGVCSLRPGVTGLSDNITVISIVDRFLEHARIYHAYHDGDHRVFISSADLMERNLSKRVELLVPVEEKKCKLRLLEALELYFSDNVSAKRMLPDGTYTNVDRTDGDLIRSQRELYEQAVSIKEKEMTPSTTLLEPLRPS